MVVVGKGMVVLIILIVVIIEIISNNLMLSFSFCCFLLELNEEIFYFLDYGNIWMVVQCSKGLFQIPLNTSSTKRREFQIHLIVVVVRNSSEGTTSYLLDDRIDFHQEGNWMFSLKNNVEMGELLSSIWRGN